MKTTNKFLALAMMAMAMFFNSCSEDDDPVGPSQQEIETKIVGKWKSVTNEGKETLTNERFIETYEIGGTGFVSSCNVHPVTKEMGWINKKAVSYTISGSYVAVKDNMDGTQEGNPVGDGSMLAPEPIENKQQILSIDNNKMSVSRLDGEVLINFEKVTVDYSQDIIGMWEGVEMTGPETYGDAHHRIHYKADGTYEYFSLEDGQWVALEDEFEEWNVDGDWLATRWQNKDSDVVNYEWWDIDYIKDGIMKWSALREDAKTGKRFTTTFTWKKIEIEGA